MRLLNTKTLKLHSFVGSNRPKYAILSHRWDSTEVTFQDLETENGVEIARANVKIAGCCRQAMKHDYDWVWIDSCCIDKSSSAELSEAINSMFRWYQDAVVCYVYLSDVKCTASSRQQNFEAFRQSSWFTRGWTLQELLAPSMIIFYDQGWNDIGTKTTLEGEIQAITKITHLFDFSEACIAQKMSWASTRETTRVEDKAYCLMGLFDVNMPILYGEGSSAFLRLQEEIIKKSDDESIFAWAARYHNAGSGMLASSPDAFSHGGDIIRDRPEGITTFPYEMTNKGLRIQLQLTVVDSSSSKGKEEKAFSAPLRCKWKNTGGIITIRLAEHHKSCPDTFSKITSEKLSRRSVSYKPSKVSSTRIVYVKAPKTTHYGRKRGASVYEVAGSAPTLTNSMCSLVSDSWTIFHSNPIAGQDCVFLGMTFKNGRAGVQLQTGTYPSSPVDFACPQWLKATHLDRVKMDLKCGHVVDVTLRRANDSFPYPDETYIVDISMTRLVRNSTVRSMTEPRAGNDAGHRA